MDCGTSHHRKRRRGFIHFYFQIFMGVETSNPNILQYHGIVHGKFSEIFLSPGHRLPPAVVRPLKKNFLVDRFWWSKNQNIGLGLNFLLVKKNWKSFQLFPKNKKQNFQKSANFGLKFFFAYESENYKKPKYFDFWYHFGDRPKKLGKIFKIFNFFFISKFNFFDFSIFLRIFNTF